MTTLAPLPVDGATRIVFIGTPEIAVPYLDAVVAYGVTVELVVTRPDTRRGRGTEVSPSPVKLAAQRLGIPVSHDVRDVLNLTTLKPPVVGVVVAFGELIPAEILFQVPMVNVHFSLLPRWRGAAPVERAILAGDNKTGVCIMRVVEELDAGAVYARREVAVTNDDDSESLKLKLNEVAIEMLLSKLKQGFVGGVDQVGEPTYARKIQSGDLKIDWHQSTQQVLRQVRVGGAFTFVNGHRVKILRARIIDRVSTDFLPGQICELSKSSCVVAVADGAISIIEVHPQGKSAMPVGEWLKGARLDDGVLFGV